MIHLVRGSCEVTIVVTRLWLWWALLWLIYLSHLFV